MPQATKPSSKPAPLGRGLSALFGDTDASYQAKPAAPLAPAENRKSGAMQVPLVWLQPGAFQPRRHFDEDALKELAESIKARGIIEPLVVRSIIGLKDSYEIIAGERRWRAAQIAGLHEIPITLHELTDREALEFGLIENVQRENLSPLEEAEAYQRLLEEFDHTQEELAKVVGKSRSHIANMLRILTLPTAVKQMINKGELSLGHARAVINARDPLALATEIVKRGLNTRQAEALAKQGAGNRQIHKRKVTSSEDADIKSVERDLERIIGLKITIVTKGKAGSLTVHYHDVEQLDGIIKKLRG